MDRNLYRWRVKVKNHFPEPLATQLVLYASQFDVNDLILEIAFDSSYPMVPPKIRIVEPRFLPWTIPSLGAGGVLESSLFKDGGDWTPVSTVQHCITEIVQKISAACTGKDESFEFIDPSLRSAYSSSEATSQRTGFVQHYRVMSVDDLVTDLGGKVALPASALEEISRAPSPEFPLIFELKQTRPRSLYSGNHESHISSSQSVPYPSSSTENASLPLTGNFQLPDTHSNQHLSQHPLQQLKKTYAGVSTFDAVDGYVLIPSWILKNIEAEDGDVVCVRSVTLPKGSLVTLQPHDPTSFLTMEQPKEVLESVLRSYVALQSQDLLHVSFDHTLHAFTIVNTLPSYAIDIRDTDLRLEIQMPPDFVPTSSPSSSSPTSSSPFHDPLSNPPILVTSDSVANTQPCSNCKRNIPKTSIATHEAFCRRNNVSCDLCGQIIRISDKSAHFEEAHKPIKCACGETIELRFIAQHKQQQCSHRLKSCHFCKLRKKMIELPAHEEYCGSRTEKCPKCQRFVALRDLNQHARSRCTYPPQPEETGLFAKLKGFFSSATDG